MSGVGDPSGAKALCHDRALIAALEALRHPKAEVGD
jgi:hypothetical protein